MEADSVVDVVVIGAGISGLTAAERLAAAGRSVRVVEARDRVGGRTEGGRFASGTPIELGGQWVGPTQAEVLALADRLGLETFQVHDEGEGLLFADGERRQGGEHFGLSAKSAEAFAAFVRRIDEIAATIDLAEPWNSPDARVLDEMTAREWVDAECDDAPARAFIHVMLASIFAADSCEYSALHLLFYLGSGGGLHRMMITVGGAQEARVLGGTHQLSEGLAALVEKAAPGSIALGEEVLEVSGWDAGAELGADAVVEVRTTVRTLRARRVLCAMPPAMTSRISFSPPLPANRHAALTHMLPGAVVKFQIEYPRPFWREAGLSGTVLSLDHDVSLVYDNCVPDSERGILVAFMEGAHARALSGLTDDERAQAVLNDLVAFFGPEAGSPTEVLQRNWSEEPFTRGCYGGRFGTGLWTTVGTELATPIAGLHFAGAETAAVWNGYLDGAIRSGQRAAEEIVSALAR